MSQDPGVPLPAGAGPDLTSVLRQVSVGLLVLDTEARVRFANPAALSLFGLPEEDLLGHPFPAPRLGVAREQLREQGVEEALQRALAGEDVPLKDVRFLSPADGRTRWYDGTCAPHRDDAGRIEGVVATIHDVTDRKILEERSLQEALHDPLTQLPNRALFLDRLSRALERARRRQSVFAVLYLDLDRFKVVTESLGPKLADDLLVAVARRLKGCLRGEDTVARLGGDEFAVLMEDMEAASDAVRTATRMLDEVSAPFWVHGQEVYTTGSIGICLGSAACESGEDVLRDADTALYRAKALGRGRHQVFDPSMHDRAVELQRLETDLRRALERGELRVHYQPIVTLSTGRITSVEALVRWHHPERGLVLPDEFIPLAEETGLIVPLGRWTLFEACRQVRAWQERPGCEHLVVNVNVSLRQFAHEGLADDVAEALRTSGLPPSCLALELTESSIVADTRRAAQVVAELKALGVALHIDDFGIGHSSLSSLHRFPIDGLKIDRSFVSRMGNGEMEIVRTVLLMAQGLDMSVVAEGVETAEQLAQLRALRCAAVQGFFFSRPLDATAAGALIGSDTRW